jgi:ketosteroid isomerase-like protein
MPADHQQIFQRYVHGVMTSDVDAVAGMFADDGVYELPLAPLDGDVPRRTVGPPAIRDLRARLRDRAAADAQVNIEKSRYQLHETSDPAVFIAEVDTAFDKGAETEMFSLVYIFRVRGEQIALLREYFAAEWFEGLSK